ncbi:Asp-tRNA(Asn)/Glu-tRNA(Gln) amidotransferase subunit GatC [Candidatus Uhrbacteria bacterium]|nr:Asp-tRNA(Asn)/Glu-tRNA(Gln) amidotransferase subunit GatC [Candidatus Uhrbacteria bacterium]
MALTRDEIKRLADLSRLSLSEEEMQRMEETIDPVLEYVGRLSNVDTTGVPETEGDALVRLREDVVDGSSDGERAAILSNFPDKAGDVLRVPGVFDKPKG